MAFTRGDGSGSISSGDTGIGASLADMFGSKKEKSAALDGAQGFRDAAKAGQFRIDPELAKGAVKDLMRAEEAVRSVVYKAEMLAQAPRIGGSDYAYKAAGWYRQGGESARDAVIAFAKVLKMTREGYEFAVRNYERMDADASQTFGKGL